MRKPAYVPEEKKCACGCGYPARPGSKYRAKSCANKTWASTFRNTRREEYNQYHREYRTGKVKVKANQPELIPSKNSGAKCNCHQYSTCMTCRNAERRRAWKAGEVPVYMRNVMTLAAMAGD